MRLRSTELPGIRIEGENPECAEKNMGCFWLSSQVSGFQNDPFRNTTV